MQLYKTYWFKCLFFRRFYDICDILSIEDTPQISNLLIKPFVLLKIVWYLWYIYDSTYVADITEFSE